VKCRHNLEIDFQFVIHISPSQSLPKKHHHTKMKAQIILFTIAAFLASQTFAAPAPPAVSNDTTIDAADLASVGLDSSDISTLGWDWSPVHIGGQYISGRKVYPAKLIAGYSNWTYEISYPEFILNVAKSCAQFNTCASFITFQAENSGNQGGQAYFGYTFKSALTFPGDFSTEATASRTVGVNRIKNSS
jgi:hypothetical protein